MAAGLSSSAGFDFENSFHYPQLEDREMYICVCRAVKDQHVRAAIEAGAHTVSAVTDACCAGDDCGACHSIIEDMIEEHLEQTEAARDGGRRLPIVVEAA